MIIPVILENTLADIKIKLDVCKEFSKLIQIDMADKKYVGNDTYKDLEKICEIVKPMKIDLDLMVENPLNYLDKKYENIEKISYYVKTGENVKRFIEKAKEFGYKVGLGIGPETQMDTIHACVKDLDYIQFYTVIPGAKGRPFEKQVISKIKDFKQKYPNIRIQTDGAVNENTILNLQNTGVEDFIVGSGIFSSSNPKDMYIKLKDMTEQQNKNQINTITDFPGKEKIIQIAILGGAAWKETDEAYIDAYETSKLLAENGYEVVNGGGPGVMEASTKGAHAGGGRVLAITYYPNKPKRHYEGRATENDFDTEVRTLDYFDRTKVMLQTTQAHIVFKGSIGTLSEFGMTWISSWIHEPHNKPIILFGDFWKEFIDLIEKHMLIVKGEEKMMRICTTPQQVIDYLKSLD